jgi:hypothetical protein
MIPSYAIYFGEKDEKKTLAYFYSENFFSILRSDSSLVKDEAKAFLEGIFQMTNQGKITSLDQLEEIINRKIQENNLPLDIDLSLVYLKNEVVYLKTIGNGTILAKRGKEIGRIISGNQCASGLVKNDDYLILGFDDFFTKFDEADLNRLIDKKEPTVIVEDLAINLKDNDDTGFLSIIIKFRADELRERRKLNWLKNFDIKNFLNHIFVFYRQLSPKKKLIFIAALFFFFIFLFNSGRILFIRATDEKMRKITTVKQEIEKKINQAEETAFFNLSAAIELINQSKNEVSNLKKEVGNRYLSQIEELFSLIKEKENKIIKKEEKKYVEFYDLTIEKKDAFGRRFYLNNADLVILDDKNGRVYRLNLEKKSIETHEDKKLKEAKLVAASGDKIFYLVEKDGIYEINEGKAKKVIEFNNDWGEIVDFWSYLGNLYLLDKRNDEVYKYLVTSDGYSKKNSYFQSGAMVNLKDANSMAIDGSIYIGFSDDILKYTSGVRDSFKASFPQELLINKVFTNKDLEKIFVWDKKNGLVFVLGKNGSYERQIRSSILIKASDMIIFNQKIFLLYGSKIYTIDL